MKINSRIQQKQDLSTNWSSLNPTLLSGEFGYETDTGLVKIGDGESSWNDLPYLNGNESYFYFDSAGELHLQKDDTTIITSETINSYIPQHFYNEGSDTIATNLHVEIPSMEVDSVEAKSLAVGGDNSTINLNEEGVNIQTNGVDIQANGISIGAEEDIAIVAGGEVSIGDIQKSNMTLDSDGIYIKSGGTINITDEQLTFKAIKNGPSIEFYPDATLVGSKSNELIIHSPISTTNNAYFGGGVGASGPISSDDSIKAPSIKASNINIVTESDNEIHLYPSGKATFKINCEEGDIFSAKYLCEENGTIRELKLNGNKTEINGPVTFNQTPTVNKVKLATINDIPEASEPQFIEGSGGLSTDQTLNTPAINTGDLWAEKVESVEVCTNSLNITTNSTGSDDAYGGSSFSTNVLINDSGINMAAPTVAIAGDVDVSSPNGTLLNVSDNGVRIELSENPNETGNYDDIKPNATFAVTTGSWAPFTINSGNSGYEAEVGFFTSDFHIMNIGFHGPLGITSYSGINIVGETNFEDEVKQGGKPLATKEYVDSKGGYPEIIDLTI